MLNENGKCVWSRWLITRLCALGLLAAAGPAALPVSAARPDTLQLREHNVGPWAHYFSYCLVPDTAAPTGRAAAGLWVAGRFQPRPLVNVFQTGFTQDRLWLRAVVVNTLPRPTRFVWNLYAFVDSAVLYVQPGGRGLPRRVVGVSGRVVVGRRPLPVRTQSTPFELGAGERAVLYLRVDNHADSYYLPMQIHAADEFLLHEYALLFNGYWPWLLGTFIPSVLFSLVLFGLLRDAIYLWYGLYVLLGTWFLLMEEGIDAGMLPQVVYGLGWGLGQYTVLLLALAAGLRIMGLFLRLRQGWPRFYRFGNCLAVLAATYALAYGLLYGPALRAGSGALGVLNDGREVLLWALLLGGCGILGIVLHRGRASQRRLARFYGLTYLFFLVGAVNFVVNHTGQVNIHLAAPNSLVWGLNLELLTLSALLVARYRHTTRQNAALRLRHLETATSYNALGFIYVLTSALRSPQPFIPYYRAGLGGGWLWGGKTDSRYTGSHAMLILDGGLAARTGNSLWRLGFDLQPVYTSVNYGYGAVGDGDNRYAIHLGYLF